MQAQDLTPRPGPTPSSDSDRARPSGEPAPFFAFRDELLRRLRALTVELVQRERSRPA